MPRELSTNPIAVNARNWRKTHKSQVAEYNRKYTACHKISVIYKDYDVARARYRTQARALLRILNNFYKD